jgi:hypothetical protein
MLFDTQIRGRIGSPNVAGSTSRLSAGTSPGSASDNARRPPPARRTPPLRKRLAVEVVFAPIDRRTRETGDLRDQLQTAASRAPHLRRKQPTPTLVKPRADRLPSQPNRSLVDHAIKLRPFAPPGNPLTPELSHAPPTGEPTKQPPDSIIVRNLLSLEHAAVILNRGGILESVEL